MRRLPPISAVVLTMGDRPAPFARAVESVRAQAAVECEVVVVSNGAPADTDLSAADVVLALPENVGISDGRNRGAAAASGDYLLFLDDDAEILGTDVLATAAARLEADPGLAVVALRLVDAMGHTARRHVPRVGSSAADRSGPVAGFLGGACVIRRAAFESVGGYDPRFFYAMEETDLVWQLVDRGWSIWYEAGTLVMHPKTLPAIHPNHVYQTARNRAWAAWRSLPHPLDTVYLSAWAAISRIRREPVEQTRAGYRAAFADKPTRRPMRWRTVLRLTRLGRPPVI